MTDAIEQKALALVNEVRAERRLTLYEAPNTRHTSFFKALCRAIEQHEAFRQEVSDAVVEHIRMTDEDCSAIWCNVTRENLDRFIIAKPDPLVEAVKGMGLKPKGGYDWAYEFRTALAARGLKIVEFPMSNDKAAQDRAYWYRQGKEDGWQMCKENEIDRLREELAEAYIKLSGKSIHASDCATSNTPAMEPGPCDCDTPEDGHD